MGARETAVFGVFLLFLRWLVLAPSRKRFSAGFLFKKLFSQLPGMLTPSGQSRFSHAEFLSDQMLNPGGRGQKSPQRWHSRVCLSDFCPRLAQGWGQVLSTTVFIGD